MKETPWTSTNNLDHVGQFRKGANVNAVAAIKSLKWLGVEGTRDNLPFLARVRDMPESLVATPELSCLFVITYSYVADDPTHLPSPEQYNEIGRFEDDVIDRLEDQKVGVLVFSRTWNGTVRYFCYVVDQEQAADFLKRRAKDWTSCELAAGLDPEWLEYRRLTASFPR